MTSQSVSIASELSSASETISETTIGATNGMQTIGISVFASGACFFHGRPGRLFSVCFGLVVISLAGATTVSLSCRSIPKSSAVSLSPGNSSV